MKCAKCDTQIREGETICSNCGYPVTTNQNNSSNNMSNKKKTAWKLIFGLILFVIIIVITYIIISKNNEINEANNSNNAKETSEKNNSNTNKQQLYTIKYNGIDCPTPSLILYDDNTYEYYYTFTTNEKQPTPKTGTYNYDINEIINNINNNEENYDPYTITDNNGNKYTTSGTNEKLIEFLNSIDVNLVTCLDQE